MLIACSFLLNGFLRSSESIWVRWQCHEYHSLGHINSIQVGRNLSGLGNIFKIRWKMPKWIQMICSDWHLQSRLIPPFPGPSKSSDTRKPSAPRRYETVTTSEWSASRSLWACQIRNKFQMWQIYLLFLRVKRNAIMLTFATHGWSWYGTGMNKCTLYFINTNLCN